jgi:hypothetical protein
VEETGLQSRGEKTEKRNPCTTLGREAGGCAGIAQDRDGRGFHQGMGFEEAAIIAKTIGPLYQRQTNIMFT